MGQEKQSTSGSTTNNTTQQYTPTAEETALNKLQLGQAQAFDPMQRQLNELGGNLISKLLTGDQNLPGFMGGISQGVDSNAQLNVPYQMNSENIDKNQYMIGENVVQDITQNSLRDMNSQLAKSGAGTFLESGAAQASGIRTAGDIRRNSAQYNSEMGANIDTSNLERNLMVQEGNIDRGMQIGQYNMDSKRSGEAFNIGNWLNMLNLGVGGQAQVQQPILSTTQQVGGRLAGLRTGTGTSSGTSSSTTLGMNPFMKSFQTSLGSNLGSGSFGNFKAF